MIALDTTAIIDLFRGEQKIKKVFREITEPFCTTRVNYLELMFGLDDQNSKHKKEEQYYDEFMSTLKLFEIDASTSKEASKIFWQLKREGKMVDELDCLIAGIMLNNGVTRIISRNEKHFSRIPKINVMVY